MAVNLANQRGFSVLEVIAECQRATGASIPYEFAPRRPGDPAALVGSAELARRKLGWTAKHSDLATIVASAWRWHQMHPAGYASQG
jgi:UDP-glucose 4-epimerase